MASLSANEPRKDIASQLLKSTTKPDRFCHTVQISQKVDFAFSRGILKFSVAEGYSQLNKQEEKNNPGIWTSSLDFGLSYHSLKLFSIGCVK